MTTREDRVMCIEEAQDLFQSYAESQLRERLQDNVAGYVSDTIMDGKLFILIEIPLIDGEPIPSELTIEPDQHYLRCMNRRK